MCDDTVVRWIINTLVPRMVSTVDRWKGMSVRSCEVKPCSGMKDNFASRLFAVDLALTTRTSAYEHYALMVKIMVNNDNVRSSLQSDKQFSNEIHMYSNILPLFVHLANTDNVNPDSWFPDYFYSSLNVNNGEDHEDGVIVLENLTLKNFKLGHRSSLDFEHCSLALKCLAKFHAFSYAMKILDPETFEHQVIAPIQETMFVPETMTEAAENFQSCHARVLTALKQKYPEDPGVKSLESRTSDVTSMAALVMPEEPLAVLCHGDFCRNNMLFRYDGQENPCEVKLIDFQTIRYASPAIDISLFLFLCMERIVRARYWDRLFDIYHATLTQTLAHLVGKQVSSLPDCYSLKRLKEDFRRHALHGYMICVYFLPWMLAPAEELAETVRLWTEGPNTPEYRSRLATLGGDAVTTALTQLAREVIDRGII